MQRLFFGRSALVTPSSAFFPFREVRRCWPIPLKSPPVTENGADDAGEVPGLLEQVDGEIASFIADSAYDGEPVYQAVARRQHDPPAETW
jgi:hypothetical protein